MPVATRVDELIEERVIQQQQKSGILLKKTEQDRRNFEVVI